MSIGHGPAKTRIRLLLLRRTATGKEQAAIRPRRIIEATPVGKGYVKLLKSIAEEETIIVGTAVADSAAAPPSNCG